MTSPGSSARTPSSTRAAWGASFLAQNAGKRSVTINLKHRRGKDAFLRLVATADALVENFRPGVMDRLGLAYGALTEIKPDLVYCAISGFGQDVHSALTLLTIRSFRAFPAS